MVCLYPALLILRLSLAATGGDLPWAVSDYDSGTVYWVRGSDRQPCHGMRQSWVFNRRMVWLDDRDGVICYCTGGELLLTGRKRVSRWYTSAAGEVADADDELTRFVKKDPKRRVDHVSLPPLQFHLGRHPSVELSVSRATQAWQFFVAVKGRSGPPLYATAWRSGAGTVRVDLRKLYRSKGYRRNFAQVHFCLAVRTKQPAERAELTFRLRLPGSDAVVATLPVIRTIDRARKAGVPIHALVLDADGRRVGENEASVTASIGGSVVRLAEGDGNVWRGIWRGADRPGEYRAAVKAAWKTGNRAAATSLDIHVTDGRYIGYDPKLRLLTDAGRPIGPVTGSYRGQVMFKDVGGPKESPLQGQKQWDAATSGAAADGYGFHWWESLTPRELDEDFAYLARCGWSVVHLCQGWLWWERTDAGGRLAPHGAEQLALVAAAARRHGLRVLFALSHYPLGKASAPYARYLEAGYKRSDYANPKSPFYRLFGTYLRQFAAVFRDETGLLGFTAAGEGDPDCGKTFVNFVHDRMREYDGRHLLLCEPHHRLDHDPNYYRHQKAGWKPLPGGMRTYFIDRAAAEAIGVQFRIAGLGHVFMAEGLYWGYMRAAQQIGRYRDRVRETFYTGLACRNPIMMSWEERVVEDERRVFAQVRRAVDWSTPFRTPPLALRINASILTPAGRARLTSCERVLSRLPLESVYLWNDQAAPAGVRQTIDLRKSPAAAAFVSQGGKIRDALKADIPLQLPADWAANYSWSRDGRTLLAFIRDTRAAPKRAADATEAGHYTYADSANVLPADTLVERFRVECVRGGAVQLCLFRRVGDQMLLVGRGEMVRMPKPGPCTFTLKRPIAAKKGDMIGLYIPSPETHVAAHHGGRMYYVDGPLPAERTPRRKWQTERKTFHVVALGAAAAADPKPSPPAQRRKLILRNFPAEGGRLRFTLFDLARKNVAATGLFRSRTELELPEGTRHCFVLVTPE